MKPILTPLPTTPEHQAHRLKARAAAMSQPRLVNAATRIAQRKDAIRAMLAQGPLPLRVISERVGATERATKHTLRALRVAGEIACCGVLWEKI